MEQLLTIDEVAGVLRLTPYTVRKFLREKRLQGFKIGKEWRVRKDELDRFLRNEQASSREG